jgi:hypothetical protein
MSEDWIKTAGLDQRLVARCLNAEARVEELEATVLEAETQAKLRVMAQLADVLTEKKNDE